ncbi:putative multi-domain containing protein [Aduncisulcus paluster]|uniref:Multi-domain containing protein n=1 Tax=Aduncisulcus paluster TaxID=2918883 RepID=A0ABQ5KPI4_9EUKA|nr:putative multi-domain containing protein [Aduncisulcus paluster]|eukprot:gnl/Carplike_NY0171/2329_a3137_745.p1 GENE.gnl/Carplike_NY0171/2329_a3137_745~~gnl/Carplike_NY0171/2329_a3137_745.p1  ORF type:complete len:402 (-),score=64.86 gnl/Carplike_NY0171/2329_a3137_745:131-1300(-)
MANRVTYARAIYFAIFLIAIILLALNTCIPLGKYMYKARNTLPFLKGVTTEDEATNALTRVIFFAFFIFHCMMALLTVGSTGFFKYFHRHLWIVKIPILIGLNVLGIFLNRDWLIKFSYVAVVLIAVFIIFQFIAMAQLGYIANNSIYGDGSSKGALVFLLIVSILLFGLGLMFCILEMVLGDGNIHSIWPPVVTIILGIVYTVISLLWLEGCMLPCAILFCIFSTWSIVVFCILTGTVLPTWASTTVFITQYAAFFITLIVVCSADISLTPLFAGARLDQLDSMEMLSEEEEWETPGDDDKSPTSSRPEPEASYNMWYFHLILACASSFFVFSSGLSGVSGTQGKISSGTIAGASFLGAIIFTWTLVATKCFPDRDFGVPNRPGGYFQ